MTVQQLYERLASILEHSPETKEYQVKAFNMRAASLFTNASFVIGDIMVFHPGEYAGDAGATLYLRSQG